MATYAVPSGDRIWAGRDVVMPDPDEVSFTWPPGANCTIPDVSSLNVPIHPKVLYFSSGWNGYKYWMAFTPYNGNDTIENPSVVASNDGLSWTAPAPNPVVPAPDGAATGYFYNSDTHLVFKNDVMYLIYRTAQHASYYGGETTEKIYYKTSTDGESWSDPVLCFSITGDGNALALSPAISYYDSKWLMWLVSSASNPNSIIIRESTDSNPINWGDPITTDFVIDGDEPWHLDVVRIPNGWAAIVQDVSKGLVVSFSADGTTWADIKRISTNTPLAYRSSMVATATGFDCWITDWDNKKIRPLALEVAL